LQLQTQKDFIDSVLQVTRCFVTRFCYFGQVKHCKHPLEDYF